MRNVKTLICRFAKDESGAPATEYALLAAFIAIVMAGGAFTLGGALDTLFTDLGSSLAATNLEPLPVPAQE